MEWNKAEIYSNLFNFNNRNVASCSKIRQWQTGLTQGKITSHTYKKEVLTQLDGTHRTQQLRDRRVTKDHTDKTTNK